MPVCSFLYLLRSFSPLSSPFISFLSSPFTFFLLRNLSSQHLILITLLLFDFVSVWTVQDAARSSSRNRLSARHLSGSALPGSLEVEHRRAYIHSLPIATLIIRVLVKERIRATVPTSKRCIPTRGFSPAHAVPRRCPRCFWESAPSLL